MYDFLNPDKEKIPTFDSVKSQTTRKSRARRILNCLGQLILATSLMGQVAGTTDVTALNSVELKEMTLLSGLSLPDKQFAFYNLTVTDNVYSRFKNGIHLSFNVYPTSFRSDPDIYLSKVEHATKIENAEWHSAREGFDQLIVHRDDFKVGDVFYLTVACVNQCSYDLKMNFAREYTLREDLRQIYRWGGHETNIFRYKVPAQVGPHLETEKLEISMEAEIDYKFIEIALSHDPTFSVFEDKPEVHLTDSGLSIQMTKKEKLWCSDCYVYIIVNMIEDKRLYATGKSSMLGQAGEGLVSNIGNTFLANAGRFECQLYTVSSGKNDLTLSFTNWQGQADYFLAARMEPDDPNGSTIKFRTKKIDKKIAIIASVYDRKYWAARLGDFYVCAQAHDTLSTNLIVKEEKDQEGKYPAKFDVLYNFLVHQDRNQQFVFSDESLATQSQEISFEASVYMTKYGDQNDLQFYYILCTYEDDEHPCGLHEDEEEGFGTQTKIEVEKTKTVDQASGSSLSSFHYRGKIQHDHTPCLTGSICKYSIGITNPQEMDVPRSAELKLELKQNQMEDIEPRSQYAGILNKGDYKHFRILGSKFNVQYIHSMTIDLKSYLGDADLFVSTGEEWPTQNNFELASRSKDHFDRVILNDSGLEQLASQVYISVYGESYSEYELIVSVEYHPTQNEKLEKAVALTEQRSIFHKTESAYDEAFLSYRPWWSAHENKQIVLLADSPHKEVTFYIDLDNYPKVYKTDWIDKQEMFALQPWNPGYSHPHEKYGTYYIRVRPVYNLADLLIETKQDFSYFFRAFSQPAGDALTDLYQDYELAGVAFEAQSSYYRHFITDCSHTIRVTLQRLSGKGFPKLMVKLGNKRSSMHSINPHSYDQRAELNGSSYSVHIDMHQKWRYREANNKCKDGGYWKQGGSELCTLYMAVECSIGEEVCAYKIKLEVFEYTKSLKRIGEPVKHRVPTYVPKDQDYTDLMVPYNQTAHLYYPVDSFEHNNMLIFVNKTSKMGENGNLTLIYDVEPDCSKSYKEWKYPIVQRGGFRGSSRTKNSSQPEMIYIPAENITEACNSGEDCSLTIGLWAESESLESHGRIRIFEGSNELQAEKPILETHEGGDGAIQYYWFLSHGAKDAKETAEFWQHTIALGIETKGADFDLYVSVMDGRFPTDLDYDFKSTNKGADVVFLTSDDPLFQHDTEDSWDPSVGMIVVVGVKSLQKESADFTLLFNGPKPINYDVKVLIPEEILSVEVDDNSSRSPQDPYRQVYKFYNWGHVNFKVNFKVIKGSFKVYLNTVSETEYEQNAFTAIGLTANNADWWTEVSVEEGKSDKASVLIRRADLDAKPAFCYNCWYYLTVFVDHPETTAYKMQVRQGNSGDDIPVLEKNSHLTFDLKSSFKKQKMKFLLTSTDPFEIEARVNRGQVRINVALDEASLAADPIWTMTATKGRPFFEVPTEHPQFHINAWYYVSIEWTSGQPANGKITLKQQQSVSYLGNGVPKKMQFMYDNELVKFAVFAIPNLETSLTVEVEGLSPHSYPTVYFKHVESEKAVKDLDSLEFPTIEDFEHKLFDDFTKQVGQGKLSAKLQVEGSESTSYSYYTMTIMQNTYGLTDQRKPEFKITVSIDEAEEIQEEKQVDQPTQ